MQISLFHSFIPSLISRMMKNLKRLIVILSCSALLAFSSDKGKSSFRLVLLPDTQHYTAKYNDIFSAQTSWIAEHSKEFAFVLQQGDITNNNTDEQWKAASSSFNLMDGKVPYTFVPGNHDTGTGGKTDVRNTELFNKYLSYKKYSKGSSFKDAFEKGRMDNTWHSFKAGGYKWLILSLEFGPRNSVLDWAGKIIEKHPGHKVIINTHAYLYSDDRRMGDEQNHKWVAQTYGVGKDTGQNKANNGVQMWDKLIKIYPNIMFVFCGHVLNDGTGLLISEGQNGNKVYQMMANYQSGVTASENGGNGYLRIINIDPVNSEISVKTYSPYLDKYKTESDQQFIIQDVKF